MSCCDGVKPDIRRTSDLESEEYENIGENTSIEEFRGFEKLPAVVVERIDVSPYVTPKPRPILKKTALSDLAFFQCSVNLIRHDLNKLKDLYKASGTLNGDISPNMNFSCKICKKVYASEKKLLNHQHNKHMLVYKGKRQSQKRVSFSDKIIVHEVKEYHKCRKCPKIFEDYKSLKAHMKEQHKKRKCYICNYCSKKFVDRMFFKVHIKLHCEICGQLAPSKSKLMEHKRYVCGVIKLHKCKTCDMSFFKFMDLKDHSYDHMSTCYVCDICKDQFQTKCSIAHHIYFLHSRKHRRRTPSLYTKRKLGSESLFLCKFCEESSVDKDLIEIHVQLLPDLTNRAMTGYKDYYFCDQCLKQFDTEKDMLQHKWSHFLKSSDNSQERPKTILENLLSQPMNMESFRKRDIKTVYNVNEKIPDHFQPRVVLDKIKVGGKVLTESIAFVDVKSFDINNGDIKKPVVHPKSKKTIISKHQCQNCGKYYSSRYCLNRHIDTQHSDFENLRCKVCEEVFVWPSLLQRHKCIRLNIPEMPFDDARPEIHFENIIDGHNNQENYQYENTEEIVNGFDDLDIDTDNFMNAVDFELPAPIVELNEYENTFSNTGFNGQLNELNQNFNGKVTPLHSGFKVVMQEVPIEF